MEEQEWRDHRWAFVEYVKGPVLDDLLDDLEHRAVFNAGEVDHIKCQGAHRDQARALIKMVMNKGREAKRILLVCIQNRDSLLAKQMKIVTQQGPEAMMSPSPPDLAHSEERLTPCSEELFQKIQREQAGQIYDILDKHCRTRLALIINNQKFDHLRERSGSQHDEIQMERLLQGLGYQVELMRNLTSKDMETSLTKFSMRAEHNKSDSTFIVIMSHGLRDRICGTAFKDENTGVQDENADVLYVDTIFKLFNNKNCKGLRNKPKVIVIQACRGENRASVLVSDGIQEAAGPCPVPSSKDLDDDGLKKVLIESDFFCLCSSTPDTLSWRDVNKGSIFIQALVKIIRKDACTNSFDELCRKVQQAVSSSELQMPTIERTTALKKFYLFPGH
ncbi:hypothetical protein NDU88_001711 [Pleurodeles waltl]|uniref:Caspase-1 n=1 Tax=Pleurodeles waltl TaxID=8319 RepID=A0AAV7UA93_PLEWA|nr:hypothetical protein NDU88_001711 [Pleurodeles waltl]